MKIGQSVEIFFSKKVFEIMKVFIDTREHNLMNVMNNRGIEYLKKQLDIGDVCISDEDVPVCVLERKTVSDLSSSIVDGRYHEQKARLLASGTSIGYIIEGVVNTNDKRVFGAILNTALRDNIPVLYSKNAEETVDIIQHYAQKDPEFFKRRQSYGDYSAIHVKKSNNITPRDAFISQLSVIPGVSRSLGAKIQQTYPTMRVLVEAVSASEHPEQLFTSIPKIGKVLSQRIVHFLCSDA
jgi:ERCC4-type nuclease